LLAIPSTKHIGRLKNKIYTNVLTLFFHGTIVVSFKVGAVVDLDDIMVGLRELGGLEDGEMVDFKGMALEIFDGFDVGSLDGSFDGDRVGSFEGLQLVGFKLGVLVGAGVVLDTLMV